MWEICDAGLGGGRPAWSTAVGLGPIPYRFAGSNPAPRTIFTFKQLILLLRPSPHASYGFDASYTKDRLAIWLIQSTLQGR